MAETSTVRKRILQTALDLFLRKGYAVVSVREIIETLEISKGGFYHHYPSKEALFLAVVEEALSGWSNSISAVVANTARPVEERLRDLFLSPLGRSGSYYGLLQEGFRELNYVRTRTSGFMRELLRHCENLLLDGQKSGEIRDFLDSEAWAFQIAATIEGSCLLASLGNIPNLREHLVRCFENTWRGVRALAL